MYTAYAIVIVDKGRKMKNRKLPKIISTEKHIVSTYVRMIC